MALGENEFPISQTITGEILDLEPGGLRELHWHPNADEWQYVISGEVHVTIFGSHGRYQDRDAPRGRRGLHPNTVEIVVTCCSSEAFFSLPLAGEGRGGGSERLRFSDRA